MVTLLNNYVLNNATLTMVNNIFLRASHGTRKFIKQIGVPYLVFTKKLHYMRLRGTVEVFALHYRDMQKHSKLTI